MIAVRRTLLGSLIVAILNAVPLHGQRAVAPDVGIDHIILRATNLARGIEAFTRLTGVVPTRGGQHPGRGTENALVSLGADHYLELLAPIPSGHDSVAGAPEDTVPLRPAGWAVHTRDLETLIARVGAAGFPLVGPTPGSRRALDGTLLEWRTAGTSNPGLTLAPFFIEWGSGTAHPSRTSPGGCRLVSLGLVQPDTTELSAFLRAAGYEPVLEAGTRPAMRVVLDCPRGRVSFAS
jgi:hypothetical protein